MSYLPLDDRELAVLQTADEYRDTVRLGVAEFHTLIEQARRANVLVTAMEVESTTERVMNTQRPNATLDQLEAHRLARLARWKAWDAYRGKP